MARPAIPGRQTLKIYVPGDLDTKLKALAAQQDRTVSDMVRVLIRDAVSPREAQQSG